MLVWKGCRQRPGHRLERVRKWCLLRCRPLLVCCSLWRVFRVTDVSSSVTKTLYSLSPANNFLDHAILRAPWTTSLDRSHSHSSTRTLSRPPVLVLSLRTDPHPREPAYVSSYAHRRAMLKHGLDVINESNIVTSQNASGDLTGKVYLGRPWTQYAQ